jgi:hypothetical protein
LGTLAPEPRVIVPGAMSGLEVESTKRFETPQKL